MPELHHETDDTDDQVFGEPMRMGAPFLSVYADGVPKDWREAAHGEYFAQEAVCKHCACVFVQIHRRVPSPAFSTPTEFQVGACAVRLILEAPRVPIADNRTTIEVEPSPGWDGES